MAAHAQAAQKPTLFIVRHGERVDETSHKAAWKAQTPANRRFDPPLTAPVSYTHLTLPTKA